MATPSKTVGTSVLAIQSVASNTVVISNPIDVATKFFVDVYIWFGRRATTALTNPANFRIETSSESSGDGFWIPVSQVSSDTATSTGPTLSSQATSGTNDLPCTITNFVVGDLVYIDDPTIGQSEWGIVKSTATGHLYLEDNLVYTHPQTTTTVYRIANRWKIGVDVSAASRLRVVADCSGTGQSTAIRVKMTSLDSVG